MGRSKNSNPREKQRELVGSSTTALEFSWSIVEQARGAERSFLEDDIAGL